MIKFVLFFCFLSAIVSFSFAQLGIEDEEFLALIDDSPKTLEEFVSRKFLNGEGVVLKDRVLLITGASSGIGSGLAEYFAIEFGAKVVITGRRADKLQTVADAISRQGGQVLAVAGDVTSEQDQARAFLMAEEHFGEPVSMTIANAGFEGHQADLINDPMDKAFLDTLNVNLVGAYITLREAVKSLRRYTAAEDQSSSTRDRRQREGGAIIFISSGVTVVSKGRIAELPAHVSAVYTPSKEALNGLARAAAGLFLKEGMRVYLSAPHCYASEMLDRFTGGQHDVATALFNPLFPTLGTHRHLGAIYGHLLSNTTNWAPGTTILSDHDATFSSQIFREFYESSFTQKPILYADQVLDAAGFAPYDFSKNPSPWVNPNFSADAVIEKLQTLLYQ